AQWFVIAAGGVQSSSGGRPYAGNLPVARWCALELFSPLLWVPGFAMVPQRHDFGVVDTSSWRA
ncbi:hypothetical protein BG74_01645, partial [Sodalis-like endosymbiont of Proechinophthirus fluctus]|uniref:hypothetical protein n=1 Tax=Sodalis-like endosymbiont of Proechinophthirus fluctus TaxID=1462730 RepID=UPI0007A92F8C